MYENSRFYIVYWIMYIQIYFLAFLFIKTYPMETIFNVPSFKVSLLQFQWSKVNHHSFKFPSTKIFLSLVFKSTALRRNLKWGFHTKCPCLHVWCITSFLTLSPCLHYLYITCLTFSFDIWIETAVKAISLNLCNLPCTSRLWETEMKCTFIMCYKYVWKVVTITGNYGWRMLFAQDCLIKLSNQVQPQSWA
jgi:hypothetical protein